MHASGTRLLCIPSASCTCSRCVPHAFWTHLASGEKGCSSESSLAAASSQGFVLARTSLACAKDTSRARSGCTQTLPWSWTVPNNVSRLQSSNDHLFGDYSEAISNIYFKVHVVYLKLKGLISGAVKNFFLNELVHNYIRLCHWMQPTNWACICIPNDDHKVIWAMATSSLLILGTAT